MRTGSMHTYGKHKSSKPCSCRCTRSNESSYSWCYIL